MAEKKTCPVNKETFLKDATPVAVTIGDNKLFASPKVFSTGSFGFGANGKGEVDVNGTKVPVQINILITAINSKPAPTE